MNQIKSEMSWDEYFMRHVYLAASKSKDPRTKIGAILVKDGIIISEGFNGFARGVKDNIERYTNKQTKYDYIVHGEANAILNAARHGISTKDSILYTQGIPCQDCAKALIQAGIKEIVIHGNWPDMGEKWLESVKKSQIMFKEANIPWRLFHGVLSTKGRVDGNDIFL